MDAEKLKLKDAFERKMHQAIETENFNQLREAFSMDYFINGTNYYRQSCMDYLVTIGYKHESFAKWSLTTNEIGINGNIHESGDRPIRLAAKFNTNFAKYLLTSPDLKEKANINYQNDGSSVLLEAIEAGHFEFVKYVLNSPELSVNATLHGAKQPYHDPLVKACENNQDEMVKYFLTSNELKRKTRISRFNFEALKIIISKDNINLFNFLIDKNLINIHKNKEEYFALAVISDSTQIACKIETYFENKPELNQMFFNGESLFYQIAKKAHYSKILNHSYLYQMLEKTHYMPSEQEKQNMHHFYIYDEPAKPLLLVIQLRDEKLAIENLLKKNTIKPMRQKI